MHLLIYLDCAEKFNLELSSMVESMIVDTPTLGPVTTLWVCLNCLLTIYGKNFRMNLVCLPLNKLNLILGMNWLELNHVHINFFYKSVSFLEFDASEELFLSAKQVDEFMKDDDEMFMTLVSFKVRSKVVIGQSHVVCDFPEVFSGDINDFPSEREVEFSIDLVPGTSPVSMSPYRMFASELNGLKKQLKELLEKMFV